MTLSSFARYNLGCRWSCRTESLGYSEADKDALELLSTLFLKNDLEMGWLSDVQKVLWVLAPELIFFSLLIDSSTSSSIGIPFALERLLYGVLKLCELDLLLRREDTKIEWPLAIFLVCDLGVRNDHIMDRLFIVLWS